MRVQKYLALALMITGLAATSVYARGFAGGMRGGGGARVSASTSFRPGAGITRSTTVAAGRYHTPALQPRFNPVVRPAYNPGLAYHGAAIRTIGAVAITRNVIYRTAAGYNYSYGEPSSTLPAPSCSEVMWEGSSAYSCDGVIYAFDGAQYYPVQGASY
jgi:hypothetical protein